MLDQVGIEEDMLHQKLLGEAKNQPAAMARGEVRVLYPIVQLVASA